MNFIEAAKKSEFIRRIKCSRHSGASGQSWIYARFALEQGRNSVALPYQIENYLLTWDDLMADDWEVKPEPCKHEPSVVVDIKSTRSLDSPLYRARPLGFYCLNCNIEIKAKEWIADEN